MAQCRRAFSKKAFFSMCRDDIRSVFHSLAFRPFFIAAVFGIFNGDFDATKMATVCGEIYEGVCWCLGSSQMKFMPPEWSDSHGSLDDLSKFRSSKGD